MPEIAPGWYDDPEHEGRARWWNGIGWSDLTQAVPSGAREANPGAANPGAGAWVAPGSWVAPGAPPRGLHWAGWTGIGIAVAVAIGAVVIVAVNVVDQAAATAERQQAQQQSQQWYLNPATKGTATSPPVPAPVLSSLTLPVLSGAVQQTSAGGIQSEESSQFTIETGAAQRNNVPIACAPLTFDSPVAGGTRNSVNPVEALPAYQTANGATMVTGGLQAFATTQDAVNFVGQIRSLLASCNGGFADDGGTDIVSPASASAPSAPAPSTPAALATVSWTQSVRTPAGSSVIDIVDVQVGRFVARSFCRQTAPDTNSAALCTAWTAAVTASAATAH